MALYLVDPALELSIELYISTQIEESLAIQWERLKDRTARDAFCRRMTTQLESLIPEAIDWDIKEPTQAQVSYAMAISKDLDIPIPPDALRSRGFMHEFLGKYTLVLKAKRENKQT